MSHRLNKIFMSTLLVLTISACKSTNSSNGISTEHNPITDVNYFLEKMSNYECNISNSFYDIEFFGKQAIFTKTKDKRFTKFEKGYLSVEKSGTWKFTLDESNTYSLDGFYSAEEDLSENSSPYNAMSLLLETIGHWNSIDGETGFYYLDDEIDSDIKESLFELIPQYCGYINEYEYTDTGLNYSYSSSYQIVDDSLKIQFFSSNEVKVVMNLQECYDKEPKEGCKKFSTSFTITNPGNNKDASINAFLNNVSLPKPAAWSSDFKKAQEDLLISELPFYEDFTSSSKDDEFKTINDTLYYYGKYMDFACGNITSEYGKVLLENGWTKGEENVDTSLDSTEIYYSKGDSKIKMEWRSSKWCNSQDEYYYSSMYPNGYFDIFFGFEHESDFLENYIKNITLDSGSKPYSNLSFLEGLNNHTYEISDHTAYAETREEINKTINFYIRFDIYYSSKGEGLSKLSAFLNTLKNSYGYNIYYDDIDNYTGTREETIEELLNDDSGSNYCPMNHKDSQYTIFDCGLGIGAGYSGMTEQGSSAFYITFYA